MKIKFNIGFDMEAEIEASEHELKVLAEFDKEEMNNLVGNVAKQAIQEKITDNSDMTQATPKSRRYRRHHKKANLPVSE